MASTATADHDLSPEAALQEIGRVERIQDALARRTAGVTWMIWGIAAPAIFLSYSYAGAVGAFEGDVSLWVTLLWAPWVAMGVLATVLLWNSAGLVLPVDPDVSRREGVLTMVVFLVLIFGTMAALGWAGVGLNETAIALIGLGVANVGMGSFGLQSTDRVDRLAWLAVGVVLLLAALLGSVALDDVTGEELHRAWGLIAPIVTAVAYFGAGAFLANRG